jgi:hypothetical protein
MRPRSGSSQLGQANTSGTRAANNLPQFIMDLHVWRRSWGAMACTSARFTAQRTTRLRTSAWAGGWCHVKDAHMYWAAGQAVPVGRRILELNPKHTLVTGLQQVHKNRSDDSSLVETPELLTAQPFSPKATHPRSRQSSPDCSRSVWPAPYRGRHRSLSRSSPAPCDRDRN